MLASGSSSTMEDAAVNISALARAALKKSTRLMSSFMNFSAACAKVFLVSPEEGLLALTNSIPWLTRNCSQTLRVSPCSGATTNLAPGASAKIH